MPPMKRGKKLWLHRPKRRKIVVDSSTPLKVHMPLKIPVRPLKHTKFLKHDIQITASCRKKLVYPEILSSIQIEPSKPADAKNNQGSSTTDLNADSDVKVKAKLKECILEQILQVITLMEEQKCLQEFCSLISLLAEEVITVQNISL